jgi:hypothetical protein
VFSRYRHNDKWDCHGDEAPAPVDDDKPYNGADDFAKSIDVAYEAIRERKAAGGPGWAPREPEAGDGFDIPGFLQRRAK